MGYWDEKRDYEEVKSIENCCTFCGKRTKIVASCQHTSFLGSCGKYYDFDEFTLVNKLCKTCARRCKDCKKYFCPKHIEKHKCD